MKDGKGNVRIVYFRPLLVAAVFTVIGQAMLFVLTGVDLHPDVDSMAALLWSSINALAAAVATGLMVGFIVGKRYTGMVGGVVCAFCYATVLIGGSLICFEVDMTWGLCRLTEDPLQFFSTALVLALLMAPLYGWLLHSRPGKALLSGIGL